MSDININEKEYQETEDRLYPGGNIKIYKSKNDKENKNIIYIESNENIQEILERNDFKNFINNVKTSNACLYFKQDLLTTEYLNDILKIILKLGEDKETENFQYESIDELEKVIEVIKQLEIQNKEDYETKNEKIFNIIRLLATVKKEAGFNKNIVDGVSALIQSILNKIKGDKIDTASKRIFVFSLYNLLNGIHNQNKNIFDNFEENIKKPFKTFIDNYQEELKKGLNDVFIKKKVIKIIPQQSKIKINLNAYKKRYGNLDNDYISRIDELKKQEFTFENPKIDIDSMITVLNIFGEIINNEDDNIKNVKNHILNLLQTSKGKKNAIEKLADFVIEKRNYEIITKIGLAKDEQKLIINQIDNKIEKENLKDLLKCYKKVTDDDLKGDCNNKLKSKLIGNLKENENLKNLIQKSIIDIDFLGSYIEINLNKDIKDYTSLNIDDINQINKLTGSNFSLKLKKGNDINLDNIVKSLTIFGEAINDTRLKQIKKDIEKLFKNNSDDVAKELADFIAKSGKDDIIEKIKSIYPNHLNKIVDLLSKKIKSEEVKIALKNEDFSKLVARSLVGKIETEKYFVIEENYKEINGIISKIEESDEGSLKLIAESIVKQFDEKVDINIIFDIIKKLVSENQKFSELVLDELFKKIDDEKYESIRKKIKEEISSDNDKEFSAFLANSLANFIVNNKNDISKKEFDIISEMGLEENNDFLNHVLDLLAIRTLFVETNDKYLKGEIENYYYSNFGRLYNEKILKIESLKEKLGLININSEECKYSISKKFFNKLKKEQEEEIEEIEDFNELCNIIFDYNKLNNKKITLDFDKNIKEEAKKRNLDDSTFKNLLGLYKVRLFDSINEINNIREFDNLYKELDGGAGYFNSLEGILRNHIEKAANNSKIDKNNIVTELVELYKKRPLIYQRLVDGLEIKDDFKRVIVEKAKKNETPEDNKDNKIEEGATRTEETNKYDWFVNKVKEKYDAKKLGLNTNEYKQTINKLAGYYCEGNEKRSELIDEAVERCDYKYLEVLCKKIGENKKSLNQVIRGKISKILRRKYNNKIEKYNEIVENANLYLKYTKKIKNTLDKKGKKILKKLRKKAYEDLKKLAGISFIFPIFRTKTRIEKMLKNAEKHLEKYNSGIRKASKVAKETIEAVEPIKTKTASILERNFPKNSGRNM